MEPQPSRFAIARAHSSRDRASAKRLEAAWKERDAMLNGGEPQGTSSPEKEGEGYPCPHCDDVSLAPRASPPTSGTSTHDAGGRRPRAVAPMAARRGGGRLGGRPRAMLSILFLRSRSRLPSPA